MFEEKRVIYGVKTQLNKSVFKLIIFCSAHKTNFRAYKAFAALERDWQDWRGGIIACYRSRTEKTGIFIRPGGNPCTDIRTDEAKNKGKKIVSFPSLSTSLSPPPLARAGGCAGRDSNQRPVEEQQIASAQPLNQRFDVVPPFLIQYIGPFLVWTSIFRGKRRILLSLKISIYFFPICFKWEK